MLFWATALFIARGGAAPIHYSVCEKALGMARSFVKEFGCDTAAGGASCTKYISEERWIQVRGLTSTCPGDDMMLCTNGEGHKDQTHFNWAADHPENCGLIYNEEGCDWIGYAVGRIESRFRLHQICADYDEVLANNDSVDYSFSCDAGGIGYSFSRVILSDASMKRTVKVVWKDEFGRISGKRVDDGQVTHCDITSPSRGAGLSISSAIAIVILIPIAVTIALLAGLYCFRRRK